MSCRHSPKVGHGAGGAPEDLEKICYSFPSCTGSYLIHNQEPMLNEIQVCKVESHLLQAIMYLMDVNMIHDDLRPRNYIVDEYLNVRMLPSTCTPIYP